MNYGILDQAIALDTHIKANGNTLNTITSLVENIKSFPYQTVYIINTGITCPMPIVLEFLNKVENFYKDEQKRLTRDFESL